MLPAENPPNSFHRLRCDRCVPERPAATTLPREESARSIIASNDSPDIPYRWSVNPYRGCQHACAYCFARRTHEYLDLGAGGDFEHQIIVKVNAPELLRAELRRRSWRREWLAFSGVTDCYQPLEAEYGLTRRCLAVCAERANPVSVVTKSPLVLRDLDLLQELARRATVEVMLTITFRDDAVAQQVEPGAPVPSARFEAMAVLARAGIPVTLLVAPVIPGLNDRDVPALLTRGAACGATSALYSPVRLPGNVAAVFLARLRGALPAHAERVEARIRALHGGRVNDAGFGRRMQGAGEYWASVERLFEMMARRVGLSTTARACASHATPPPGQMRLF